MRKVEFYYVEVLNETEQLIMFRTMFDKKPYATMRVINTVLPIEQQDSLLKIDIQALENITREDAKKSISVSEEDM